MSFNKPKNHVGCTVWLTGLSGSGKTTVARTTSEFLDRFKIPVKHLDGDTLRSNLNADLGFTKEDRKENNRRVAEVAALFAQSGCISFTSLISPFADNRLAARSIHENLGIKFFEVYVNAPIEICEARDPKHFYRQAKLGIIPNFTGISMAYEPPACPDLLVDTSFYTFDECQNKVLRLLVEHQIIPSAIVDPVDRHLPMLMKNELLEASELMPKIQLSLTSVQWAQTVAEGWATPLKGFMNEEEFLECIHFKTITAENMVHSQSIPIVLPLTDDEKASIANIGSASLVYNKKPIGLLTDIKAYKDRKRERCARTFGSYDVNHPVIKQILVDEKHKNWLLGGSLQLFERICWNDGLDEYRLTPIEIRSRLKHIAADAVFVFQVRNPLHNGHILLINETRSMLEMKGYKNPVLLLHPIGGWTKDDDVPLNVRIKQHQALIDEGLIDRKKTILSIFPSPMSYAGPTEVLWHLKARIVAGVDHYIVGRDPAGLKDPSDDSRPMYEPTDGIELLRLDSNLKSVNIVPFKIAAIHKATNKMQLLSDDSDPRDFENISGTKMRLMAKEGVSPSEVFMHPNAWDILRRHYLSLHCQQLPQSDSEK